LLNLKFKDNSSVKVILDDNNPLEKFILKIIKHLQYLDIEFSNWDNPYCLEDPEKLLLKYAADLNIGISVDNIIGNQSVLNYLHEIYEKNYNGNSIWLKFHEQIHRCEKKHEDIKILNLEWREKAGLLNSTISKTLVDSYGTTQIKRGDVCMTWSELGKLPYEYWLDNEPSDFSRLCELAKPWITLRPKFKIYCEEYDALSKKMHHKDAFNQWWANFEKKWCDYWNLPEYSFETQFKVIKVGTVADMNCLDDKLKQFNTPTRLVLSQ